MLKHRAMATDGATHSNFVFGGADDKTGEYFAATISRRSAGAAAGSPTATTRVCGINGNCPHMPVEVFEIAFPGTSRNSGWSTDPAGPGKFRGGLSLSKTVRCTDTPMTFSYMSDRQKITPWGIHGGMAGGKAELVHEAQRRRRMADRDPGLQQGVAEQVRQRPDRPGDRIKIASPAGGGWGPPTERDRKMVEEDLLDGYITTEQAEAVYGLAPKGGRS